jgi:EAL domain-containing protein (putative c-di-GMP-specific phosphodiesterase class I)/DNA-binding NarL/FixJ family response regulator
VRGGVEQGSSSARSKASPATTEPAVVAVADDDPTVRALFRRALERAGFEVLVATNGHRALELVRANRVDVLLLDLSMPGLNGLDTLRELRRDPKLRTLPVIMVTGSIAEADRVAGLDQGADDVLLKPVSIPELVARVRAQIRGRAAIADELEAGREQRRRMSVLVSEVPRDADLFSVAMSLAERLPNAVGVDGAAIVAFERGAARAIAASGQLRDRFPPGRLLAHAVGADLAARCQAGPWIEDVVRSTGPGDALELAFVPFRLGEVDPPIGSLVYSRANPAETPLRHRLTDLIDTSHFVVTALRPAVEVAETTNAAILDLRHVIAGRRFRVHLQPIARLATGEVFAVEALTRFDDGVRPDVRFAEATRLGLGRALERATLAAALEAAATWPADVALSVNVSPEVLRHERSLPRLFAAAGRPVIVELTEHERIDDYEAVRASFGRLGDEVRLAVDDAGSGYASLRHILSLQPSYVKLDIGWIRGIHGDPVRRSLVSGLAYFAAATNAELIAEGIETDEERTALLELGVQLGQGFLLGRPQPSPGDGRSDCRDCPG